MMIKIWAMKLTELFINKTLFTINVLLMIPQTSSNYE